MLRVTSRALAGALFMTSVAGLCAQIPETKPREAVSSLIRPGAGERRPLETMILPQRPKPAPTAPIFEPPSVPPIPAEPPKTATSSLVPATKPEATTGIRPVTKLTPVKSAARGPAEALEAPAAQAAKAAAEAKVLAEAKAVKEAQEKAEAERMLAEKKAAEMREAQARAEAQMKAEAEAKALAEAKAAEMRAPEVKAAQEKAEAERMLAEKKAAEMREAQARAEAQMKAEAEAKALAEAKAAEMRAAEVKAAQEKAEAERMLAEKKAAEMREAQARAEAQMKAEAEAKALAEAKAAEMRAAEVKAAQEKAEAEAKAVAELKAAEMREAQAKADAIARAAENEAIAARAETKPAVMQLAKADFTRPRIEIQNDAPPVTAPIVDPAPAVAASPSLPPATPSLDAGLAKKSDFPPQPAQAPTEKFGPSQVAPPVPTELRNANAALRAADIDESLAAEVAAILDPNAAPRPKVVAKQRPAPAATRLPSEAWLLQACSTLNQLSEGDRPIAFQSILRRYKKLRAEEQGAAR